MSIAVAMKSERDPLLDASPAAVDIDSLYRTYAVQVERWVMRLGGPTIDAEDVVHDVFMVVQRRLPEWRAQAKVSTWLYRITERVVHRQRRKQRITRWLRGLTGDFAGDIPTPRPTPVEELERKQASRTVYAALEGVERKQREVLVLFEIEGLSGEEIATLTGTKLATVWVQLHRARARFLERLRAMQERGEAS
ncbi:MAG TPA: sigma-70 family RNA polymerase sigma factor [Polyangia bacterium]|nr:sigma-70 family RNA polymerase sigma factor [Polyangia bacterium]